MENIELITNIRINDKNILIEYTVDGGEIIPITHCSDEDITDGKAMDLILSGEDTYCPTEEELKDLEDEHDNND